MPFPRSKKVHTEASLYEYALSALGRRMRTVSEMKRLMRQKFIAGDKDAVIDAVVNRLKEQRLLNDTQFAASYSSMRKENSKFGKQRVITDLKIKGVHGDVIETAITGTYGEEDEEALARQYIAKKRMKQPIKPARGSQFSNRPADQEDQKRFQRETARIFRTLVRAGFKTVTILRVLKNWDVDDEVLLALEEEELP